MASRKVFIVKSSKTSDIIYNIIMVNLDFGEIILSAIVPIFYFAMCGVGIWFLWHVRGRQPGNSRYSVMIYSGIAVCIILILLGFKIFGIM